MFRRNEKKNTVYQDLVGSSAGVKTGPNKWEIGFVDVKAPPWEPGHNYT